MTPAQKFWLKLMGLGLLAVALIYPLTVPFPTHAVIVDPLNPADIAKVNETAKAFEYLQILGLLDLAALACVFWLAWRVFRNRLKQ